MMTVPAWDEDGLGFPRKTAVISVVCGTFFVLLLLIFLGILGNEWRHNLGYYSDPFVASNKFVTTLLSIQRYWVVLVVSTVAIGTALALAARCTRRPWEVYILAFAAPFAYIGLSLLLVWIAIQTLVPSGTYAVTP
jgi:hypothetical protein